MDIPIEYLANDVGIAYDAVCGVSLITPLIIIFIVFLIIKEKKIKLPIILISFLFAVITFFILIYFISEYFYHETNLKIFFNLFFIQLIILPVIIISIYKFFKSDKKKQFVVKAISILIALIVILLIFNIYIITVDPNHIEYDYQISITTQNETNGYILVPFIEEDDYSSKLLNSLSRSGNISDVELIRTIKSNGLNISFSSSVELKGNGKIDRYVDIDMYGEGGYGIMDNIWVFVSMEQPDTVNIEFTWNIGGGSSYEEWDFTGEVYGNGWHKIEGYSSIAMD